MNKIIFFDARDEEVEQIKAFCEGKYECELVAERLDDKSELTDEQKQADIISVFTFSRVNAHALEQFPNLKLIALRSVGFNHIDTNYCKKHNIQVVNAAGYGNTTIAEFAFGLIFDVIRKISRAYMNLKNEHLDRDNYTGFELRGKNLGIIGTGAIGKEVIKIAKCFGMNILAFDLYPSQEFAKEYHVQYIDLETLLKESDIISLHSPLTDGNFHLINEERIKLLKPTAIIINTARGELIDSQALYEALSQNKIFGAGLDVLEAENLLIQSDSIVDFDYLTCDYIKQTLINERLLRLHNVVVTPHIAYNTKEAQDRILNITESNIKAFFEGKIQNSIIK